MGTVVQTTTQASPPVGLPVSLISPGLQTEIQNLSTLLSDAEIITPSHPAYEAESKTWSSGKNLHPKLVVRPKTVESVARVVKFLSRSSLDYNIRNSGAGSSSAKDVLISTRALTDFEFDRESEVVIIGAGCLWSEYYDKMQNVAPEYSVVAAATPFIGVAGSILAGGFSLMSKEYGCISDPENFLDAEIVKLDGSVVWASNEPDLLWGLRGGYIGLGVVTKLKLRAYRYPQDIWGGSIVIPRSKEREVAHAIAAMDSSDDVERRVFALLLPMPEVFVVNAFDALGEEHGRRAFAPLLRIEGAVDMTKITNLVGFAAMQAPAELGKGMKQVWWNPLALEHLTADMLLKSFEWQRDNEANGADAAVMYELWGTRGPASGPKASAWPRSDRVRHFCMLSIGAAPNATPAEVAEARRLIECASTELLGHAFDDSLVATSALDDFHNIRGVYGANWDRIVEIKKKYDPQGSFRGSPLARACINHMQQSTT